MFLLRSLIYQTVLIANIILYFMFLLYTFSKLHENNIWYFFYFFIPYPLSVTQITYICLLIYSLTCTLLICLLILACIGLSIIHTINARLLTAYCVPETPLVPGVCDDEKNGLWQFKKTWDDCFSEGVCEMQKWSWLCVEQGGKDPPQRSDNFVPQSQGSRKTPQHQGTKA